VITDLIQISRLGEKKRPENEKFRRWIKSHNFVERQFRAPRMRSTPRSTAGNAPSAAA